MNKYSYIGGMRGGLRRNMDGGMDGVRIRV